TYKYGGSYTAVLTVQYATGQTAKVTDVVTVRGPTAPPAVTTTATTTTSTPPPSTTSASSTSTTRAVTARLRLAVAHGSLAQAFTSQLVLKTNVLRVAIPVGTTYTLNGRRVTASKARQVLATRRSVTIHGQLDTRDVLHVQQIAID